MNRNAKLLEKIYEYQQPRNGTVTPSIVIIIFPLYEVAAQLRKINIPVNVNESFVVN